MWNSTITLHSCTHLNCTFYAELMTRNVSVLVLIINHLLICNLKCIWKTTDTPFKVSGEQQQKQENVKVTAPFLCEGVSNIVDCMDCGGLNQG